MATLKDSVKLLSVTYPKGVTIAGVSKLKKLG